MLAHFPSGWMHPFSHRLKKDFITPKTIENYEKSHTPKQLFPKKQV
jgi:hypothetical protein